MRAANPAYNSLTDLFNPQVCVCVCALCGMDVFLSDEHMNYLHRRKSWPFLREFVIYGGLTEISYMINSSNHYYRGQAFEILLSITDCDNFDWFQPHTGNQTVRSLHIQLLSLSKNIYYLSGLLENRIDSYPGGSFRALQLLAFWLSWVRAMMTKNHILYLSTRTLQELKFWTKGYGLTNNNAEEEHNADRSVDEDEIKLAQTLYKDFSYEQFHRDSSGHISLESEEHFMNGMDNLCIETRISLNFTDEERAEIFVSGFDESAMDESNDNNNSNSSNSNSNGNSRYCPVDKSEEPLITTPLTTASYVHIEDYDMQCTAVNSAVTGIASHDVLINQAMSVAVSDEPYNRVKHVESLIYEARSLKEEGNRYFKLSQYANCVTPYENAIAEIESGLEACQLQPSDGVQSEETADSLLTLKLECEELLASLHYNKATAYWKLSELEAAPHTTAEQHANSVSTYLDLCKSYCTIAISINPRHSKSIYRLCEALLREGNSTEALAIIEEYSKLCALNDLLKSLRRKCLAAFLIIQGPDDCPYPSSTSSLTSTSISVMTTSPIDHVRKGIKSNGRDQFVNESESLSEVTYTRPESHSFTETLQCADDNARTCVDVSTGADVVVKTVGSRAAKVLKQLQARESRENAHNDHAYNGFTVPIESPTPDCTAAQDGDDIEIGAHSSFEILHTNLICSDGECVEKVRHHGKEESEQRMRKKTSKIHISAVSNEKSKDKIKDKKEKKGVTDKSKEREKKEKKSKEKHRGEDKGDGEDSGCTKNKGEGSIGVAESFQRLRKLSLLFDMTFDKALVISNTNSKNCKAGNKGGVTVPVSDIGNGRGEDEGDIEVNGDMMKGRSRSKSQTQQSNTCQDGEEVLNPALKDLFDILDGHVHSAVEVRR